MPDFSERDFRLREKQLEQVRLAYQVLHDRSFPSGVVIDELSIRHELCDALLGRIEARVLVENLEPFTIKRMLNVEIQVPKTWWDHFKLTYKNKWWMRSKNINYEPIIRKAILTVVVEPMMAFPNSTVRYHSKFGKPVRIFELEEYMEEHRVTHDNL